jgi:hypothetical protein
MIYTKFSGFESKGFDFEKIADNWDKKSTGAIAHFFPGYSVLSFFD